MHRICQIPKSETTLGEILVQNIYIKKIDDQAANDTTFLQFSLHRALTRLRMDITLKAGASGAPVRSWRTLQTGKKCNARELATIMAVEIMTINVALKYNFLITIIPA